MKLKKIKELKSQFNEYIAKKEWAQALTILENMIEITSAFHHKKGTLLLKLKRHEEALHFMQQVLLANPGNVKAQKIIEKCQTYITQQKDLSDKPNQSQQQSNFAEKTIADNQHSNVDQDVFLTDETFIFDRSDTSESEEEFASGATMQLQPSQAKKNKKLHKEKTMVIQQMKKEKLFADYRVVEELGRGGMGLVYKVYNPQTDRISALKVLLSGNFADEKQVQRFIREVKTTAKLKHPNIVTLYETGFHDNHHYFTMEYIDGESLRSFLKNEKHTQKQVLEILIKVANAVDYAHKEGVIHRDLKPENIMIIGETGIPKVMDFGLAKSTQTEDHLSMTNEILGTPAYMSPEQGEGSKVSHLTDVYSLGILLYEFLGGRVPFQGKTLANILQQIFHDDPISVRSLNPEIDKELEAICLKAIEKKPNKRYTSAQSFANDLSNYLAHRPIQAKPPGQIVKIKKFCRRHPILITSAISVLFVLSFWGWYVFEQWQKSETQRQEATLQTAKIMMSKAREASISQSWRRCGVLAGKALSIAQKLESEDAQKIRQQAYSHIRTSLFRYGLLWESRDFAISATKIAYNQDETILATALESGDIALWNRDGTKLRNIAGHFGRVTSIVFMSNGTLISSSEDNTIRFWNSDNGNLLRVIETQQQIADIEISPNESILASANGHNITFWNIQTGKQIKKLSAHQNRITDIDFSQDGKLIASCSEDKTISVWNSNTYKKIQHILGHTATVNDVIFEGKTIVSASQDRTTRFWDIKSGKEIHIIPNSTIITDINIDQNKKILAMAGTDSAIYIADLTTKKITTKLEGHLEEVTDIHFNKSGNTIVSVSLDKTVRLWDMKTKKEQNNIHGHSHYVYSVAFHPTRELVASASHDKTIRLWKMTTGEHYQLLTGHTGEVNCVAFSPNGKILASCGYDNSIKLWNIKTASNIHTFLGHEEGVLSVQFSGDGKYLVSASEDKTIKLWNVATKKLISTFTGHEHAVTKAIFSPDQKSLASASYDKTIKLWNVKTGKILQTFVGHSNIVFGIDFNSTGTLLASGSEDTTIKIWQTTTGRQIAELKGHEDIVYDVRFHPNKDVLVSASEDKTIKMWDTTAFRQMRELKGHSDIVVDLDISPKGDFLVSCSEDHTLRLWNMDLPDTYKKLNLHQGEVYSAVFSKTGDWLVSAGGDNQVCLYNVKTKSKKYFIGHTDRVKTAIFNENATQIISCSSDETIRIWNTKTGEPIHVMQGHEGEIYNIALSNDDRTLVSVSADHSVRLWDIQTGKLLKILLGHTDFVYAADIATDGETIATFAHDKMIGVWNAKKQIPVKKLRGHVAPGYWLKFNPSGTLLASASVDQSIRLWNLKTGEQVKQFNTNSSAGAATFSPDEKFLVTSSYDGHIFLWEIATATLNRKIKAHAGPVYWLDFSPDGKLLASASEDGSIRLWKTNFTKSKNLRSTRLPIWVQNNVQKIPLKNRSPFNFRLDVAGSLIEYFLKKNPERITKILFGLRITKNSDTTELEAQKYIFK
ncbi:protein kinase [Candidatus Uabimicrobium sp. HlEnr_7]|uniref:protein kinase domain-containing protein n=1 Tax=Candidatus Uabimicrobium helgolandensis TaxID=3095367 RepID=UPI003557CA7D